MNVTYQDYRIYIRSERIDELPGGEKYRAELDKLHEIKTGRDERPQLRDQYAETEMQAERLVLEDAKNWVDQH